MPLTALRHLEQAKLMLDAYNEHLQADSLRSAAVYFMHSVRGLMIGVTKAERQERYDVIMAAKSG
ncbi:hypothetical protein DET54_103159 [Paenibacillus pabuli]|uniref:Uncharacterized protein n=1 Tax=Paenibacillus pabuli TaxID=1472 RepID=A0ABX9BNF7_9BACL|nr:hypothetical protein [Paenibacillus pabuli]RAI99021.1 hypothetical protein DET54_103159 [Paenibacillus pabuli]